MHPDSVFMQEALHRRGFDFAEDQKTCLQVLNDSENPHLKIQAYAGTGKTLVVSLSVDATLDDIRKRGAHTEAVFIATPSRNLRDSIVRGPDFLGHVFTEDDYGPRVVWLGRPSDSPSSLVSWESKLEQLVDARVDSQRKEIAELEAKYLKPAFERIAPWTIHWDRIPFGRKASEMNDEFFNSLEVFRAHARNHMIAVIKIREKNHSTRKKSSPRERMGTSS